MRRKIVEAAPNGGLREVWVDLGPAKALVGHGSPTSIVAVPVGGIGNVGVADGRRIPLRGTGA